MDLIGTYICTNSHFLNFYNLVTFADHFSKELMSRPVAVDHYCTYLQAAGEIDELHETLSALGRTEEAAMLKYKQCLSSTSASAPQIRTSGLQDCVK